MNRRSVLKTMGPVVWGLGCCTPKSALATLIIEPWSMLQRVELSPYIIVGTVETISFTRYLEESGGKRVWRQIDFIPERHESGLAAVVGLKVQRILKSPEQTEVKRLKVFISVPLLPRALLKEHPTGSAAIWFLRTASLDPSEPKELFGPQTFRYAANDMYPIAESQLSEVVGCIQNTEQKDCA